MKRCSLLVIPLMFLILSACVFNPSTTPLVVETSPTATPSAPAAVDLGIIGQGMAKTAAWSTDGKIMAVASSHGIYLYDTATWQTFKFIPIKDSEYRNGLAQIWFPPDGKSMWYAYVTTPKLSIYQYDLASDKTTPLYQELVFSEFTKFVFSPNGRTFANIGVTVLDEKGEPELQPQSEIREISSGKLLQTLKSDRKWWGSFNIGLASFSPHGHLFATGDSDNTVRVWSTETGLLLFEQNHDANVESVAFSPDSKMLVSTGDDATVRFWDARTGENIYTLREFNHGLVYLSYSMSGSELLLGMSDGSYQRWAVNEHFLPVAHKEMDFEPDRYEYSEYLGLQFINSNGDHLAVIQDANIQVFDLARENQSITLSEFNSSLSGVEFGPDGNLLALIDRNIHLWDMNSRKVLGTLQINQYEVTDAAFSPDGKQIAVAGNDIQIWDVGTLHKIREIDTGGGQVAYSPDGSLLATGGWYEVTIWSPDTGESIRSFQAELGKPLALSFGLNGKSLIFVAQNGVRVWDTASGKILLSKDEKKKQPDIDLDFRQRGIAHF